MTATTHHLGCYCVTLYVGGIRFYEPILIGNMVEVDAHLIYTGRTSLHIAVEVRTRDPKCGAFTKTTHCIIVFVAVNAASEPALVRPWNPGAPEQVAWHAHAVKMMSLRKALEEGVPFPSK